MKKVKYIKFSNLPPSLGLLRAGLIWLLLERFNAPAWLYGAIGIVVFSWFVGDVYRLIVGEVVDVVGSED